MQDRAGRRARTAGAGVGSLRLSRRRPGAVLLFAVLSLTVLLAMVGLVVDGGFIYNIRQRSQAATDAAALAAGFAIPYGSDRMHTDANKMIDLNGVPGTVTVSMTYPYKSDNSMVEVVTWSRYQPFFLGLVGVREIPISVRAVGQYVPGHPNNPEVPFAVGLFGAQSLSLANSGVTDSYNSTIGPYGGSNVGQKGNAGSNGPIWISNSVIVKGDCQTSGGTLLLDNTAQILGSARTGGSITMENTAEIKGTATTNGSLTGSNNNEVGGLGVPPYYTTNPAITQYAGVTIPPVVLPPIDLTGPAASNSNGTVFPQSALSGDNPPAFLADNKTGDVTLSGGVYYFSSLVTQNKARIKITGKCQIYVTGLIDIGMSSQVNTNGFEQNTPNNCVIYGTTTGPVNIGQSTITYAGIYAPNASKVEFGNLASFYGGCVTGGQLIHLNAGTVHLDVGLSASIGKPSATGMVYRLAE